MDLAPANFTPPAATPAPPPASRESARGEPAFAERLRADLAEDAPEETAAPAEAEAKPEAADAAPAPVGAPVIATPLTAAIDLQLLGGPEPEQSAAPSEAGAPVVPAAAPAPATPTPIPPPPAKPSAQKSADPAPSAETAAPSADAAAPAPPPAIAPAAAAAPAQPAPAAPPSAETPPAAQVAAQAPKAAANPNQPEPQTTNADANKAAEKPSAAKRGAEPGVKTSGRSVTPQPLANAEFAPPQPQLAAPDSATPANNPQLAAAGLTASHAPPSALESARAAPAAAQVAGEIIRRFNGQSTQFDLRLDPPELGRVEVRLEVSRDHRVTAVVTADSPQALTELARHARELTQTLQSAGLELSDAGLSFDLRQGRGDGRDPADGPARERSPLQGEDNDLPPPPMAARPVGFETWRGMRVDVLA